MKKQLVEVRNLDSFICQANAAIYDDGSIILTPGARDELGRRKVSIIRNGKPKQSCGGADSCPVRACQEASSDSEEERLFWGIAAMVKEQFNIEDPGQLKEVSCLIMKTLKKV